MQIESADAIVGDAGGKIGRVAQASKVAEGFIDAAGLKNASEVEG